MIISLEDAKKYLRVDISDDDALISTLMQSAQELCMDVARFDDESDFESAGDIAKNAVLYTLAFFYENRDNADFHSLSLRLRALLHGIRQEKF